MNKQLLIIFSLITAVIIGIFALRLSTETSENPTNDGKLVVAATIFPYQDMATTIVRDSAELIPVIPSGQAIHSFDPSPRIIEQLQQADIILMNGAEIEPWLDEVIPEMEENGTVIVNAEDLVPMITFDEDHTHEDHESKDEKDHEHDHDDHHDEDNHHDHVHGNYDPHVWLYPENMKLIAAGFVQKLSQISPENSERFADRLDEYNESMTTLDSQFQERLASCKQDSVIVSHDAFSYLENPYNIEFVAVAGLSPFDEPSSQTLEEIQETITEKNIAYIMLEPGYENSIADTLAQELNVKTLELSPLGFVDEDSDDTSYVSVMENNLNALETALSCSINEQE